MWHQRWSTYWHQQRLSLLYSSSAPADRDEELTFLNECVFTVKDNVLSFHTSTQHITHDGENITLQVVFQPALATRILLDFLRENKQELRIPLNHSDFLTSYTYELSWYPKAEETTLYEWFVGKHYTCEESKRYYMYSCAHHVLRVAKEICRSTDDYIALLHTGNIEMMKAFAEYDPRQTVGFLPYLRWRIKEKWEQEKKLY